MHDWINESDYEAPMSVDRYINSLKEELDKYKKLAENGQSAIETNKLLTEKFNRLLKLTKQILREYDFNGCLYCKHYIECKEQKCPCYEEGIGMEDDKGNKYPDMKWTCMDFNYGECRRYEEEGNTFCKDCKNMLNWEWNEK